MHSVLNYSTRERMLCTRLPEAVTGLALHPTGFLIALAHRDRIDLHHILKCASAGKYCNAGAVLHSRASCAYAIDSSNPWLTYRVAWVFIDAGNRHCLSPALPP